MIEGAEPICLNRDVNDVVTFVGVAWPAVTAISNELLGAARDDLITMNYPFISIRLANAHAVYRVETCEYGVWRAELVEGHVDIGPSHPVV